MRAGAGQSRAGRWCALLGVALGLLLTPARALAGDPYLEYWTLTSPHFRVHYHGGFEQIAQRALNIAERARRTLVGELGLPNPSITDILLIDDSDSANGIATPLPYNMILLYVTAPEDMSGLNDYDDWQLDLITHEYTHILHVENISGLPAIVNAVLGKVLAPNQRQPRWILEGLAVAMESRHSTAGRLRNSQFDMFLRADVLEGRMAELDEFSNSPRRWPGGNLWYLYGAKFTAWILDVYGPDTFGTVATHYGRSLIPYGINRAIRRATGMTYPELYAGWKTTVQREYAEQAERIRARGLREGIRLTHHGFLAQSPRFVPRACQRGADPELLYYRDNAHTTSGLYRISALPGRAERDAELTARANRSIATFGPDCSLVFETVAPSRRRHFFSDLFRLPPNVEDPSGADGRRQRLSVGLRAREPSLSPDGRRIAYVTNHAGTTTLMLADLDGAASEAAKLSNARVLVPSARFEQAFTPRFSADGARIAYSVWTAGGYRDIRVVDVASRRVRRLTYDRALDQQPTFSPDGKSVYFTSDRSGVPNVYAYDLEQGDLRQVTNVLTGAYMPELSPDGKTLVYVGYTADGFDLFSMPLDPRAFLDAPPPPVRPAHEVSLTPQRWPKTRYNPLTTILPRSFDVDFGTGTFGDSVKVSTSGADVAGLHGFTASVLHQAEPRGGPSWVGTLDYAYRRLPFDMHATLSRSTVPRLASQIGEHTLNVTEDQLSFSTGVYLQLPGTFDTQSVGLSYSVIDYHHETPVGTRGNPWSTVPYEPDKGLLANVRLGYSYSNAYRSGYSISAERGYALSFGVDVAHPATGSETTLTAFTAVAAAYVPVPIRRLHHVLALSLSGGASGGSYPRRGLFYTGGFVDQPALDVYTNGVQQGGVVLRGFGPGTLIGTEYVLFNAEYRFPLHYFDRGVSTLPVFLNHLTGVLFTDYGGAFFGIDPEDPQRDLHHSIGAELWIEALLGYRIGGNLRLGIAHPIGEKNRLVPPIQTYFVAAAAF